MILTATIRDDNGQAVGMLVLNEHSFKTGSRGYHGTGKVEIGGKKHQAQVQLVEIGSKGEAQGEAAER